MSLKFCPGCEVDKRKVCFNKYTEAVDGLVPLCKTCEAMYKSSAKYHAGARDLLQVAAILKSKWRRYNDFLEAEEVYGVYMAIYPSGAYIGQGNLKCRRGDHMRGSGHIGNKLGEKAAEFIVLFQGTKRESVCQEPGFIRGYDGRRGTLLNTDHVLLPEPAT